ncbi:uncharacterized protein LOC122242757 [Penaeus japonicus]|uniref:uncharacterized protein LOC122242757 n=1 Tax=Penaeus japonicus TaxID=27405 RepID=UPI001C713E69|nr:uncharacterized protein LOC122242757 [Penaeus japonicus]
MRGCVRPVVHKPLAGRKGADAKKIHFSEFRMSTVNRVIQVVLLSFFLLDLSLGQTNSTCPVEFMCLAVGLFPQCTNSCDVGYFRCSQSDLNQLVTPWQCDFGLVFDLNLLNPYCILPSECPTAL